MLMSWLWVTSSDVLGITDLDLEPINWLIVNLGNNHLSYISPNFQWATILYLAVSFTWLHPWRDFPFPLKFSFFLLFIFLSYFLHWTKKKPCQLPTSLTWSNNQKSSRPPHKPFGKSSSSRDYYHCKLIKNSSSI